MTDVQFANVPNGAVLQNVLTHAHYRIRERISQTIVAERIEPIATLALVEIIRPSQRAEWDIAVWQG